MDEFRGSVRLNGKHQAQNDHRGNGTDGAPAHFRRHHSLDLTCSLRTQHRVGDQGQDECERSNRG